MALAFGAVFPYNQGTTPHPRAAAQGRKGPFMPFTPQEQRILDAALNVMAKHSISGTRMHLIAKEAGMATSNLCYHFKTKQELLLALLTSLQDYFDTARAGVMESPGGTLRQRLGLFFQQKKNFILNHPRYDKVQFDFWVLGQSDESVKALFSRSFEHWRQHLTQSLLEFYPQMPPEEARCFSFTLISCMMGASMQYLNGDGLALDTYFSLCLDMMMREIEARYGAAPA